MMSPLKMAAQGSGRQPSRTGSSNDLSGDPWTGVVLASIFIVAPLLSLVAFRIFDSCLVACAGLALVPLLRQRAFGWAQMPGLFAMPLAAFIGWCAISWLWSPREATDLYKVGAVATIIVAGFILSRLIEMGLNDRWMARIGIATAAIGLLFTIDLWTEGGLRRQFGQPLGAFETYPAMHELLFAAIPIVTAMFLSGRRGLAVTVIVASTLAIFSSSSDSAKMGLLMSAPIAVVAWRLPRIAVFLAVFVGLVFLVATPWLIDNVLDWATRLAAEFFPGSHAFEREAIYRSAAYLARDVSLFGHGAGATRLPAEVWSIAEVPEGLRGLFDHAFPHNLALQIWLELGAVGMVLSAATWIAGILWVSRLPMPHRIAGLVILSIGMVIAQINHSLWQGWWIACLVFALAILKAEANRSISAPRDDFRV